ncbi:hypothetical protein [Saccharopolyspora hattusasensis]|uniref:hypothetical protein n=1 Tax=Saccharopolyspora hattusasensis TaxID=1128679 RepID=UPI003D972461
MGSSWGAELAWVGCGDPGGLGGVLVPPGVFVAGFGFDVGYEVPDRVGGFAAAYGVLAGSRTRGLLRVAGW